MASSYDIYETTRKKYERLCIQLDDWIFKLGDPDIGREERYKIRAKLTQVEHLGPMMDTMDKECGFWLSTQKDTWHREEIRKRSYQMATYVAAMKDEIDRLKSTISKRLQEIDNGNEKLQILERVTTCGIAPANRRVGFNEKYEKAEPRPSIKVPLGKKK